MSSRYRYTTMDRIFTKLSSDVTDDFDEGRVIEWTGEALEFIMCPKSYEEGISFLEVKNHRATLPKWCHAIIQVARLGRAYIDTDFKTCVKDTMVSADPEFDFAVMDSAGGLTLIPEFNFKLDYSNWKCCEYKRKYTPVRLSNNSLFNTLVCRDEESLCGDDEYKIVMGDTLVTSFRDGIVAVPYLRQATDENGYPMIPDHISFTTAIIAYIRTRMAARDFDNGREGAKGRLDKAESDWQWYCKQASNVDMMPYGIDEHQNLLEQRSYLLPKQNNYYSFFGNLGKGEIRKYNNPDGRRRRR